MSVARNSLLGGGGDGQDDVPLSLLLNMFISVQDSKEAHESEVRKI